ncbi:MAG TPA: DUF131 domain-containing protein [Thermoplasmatales archaeon]|nr:DUF131 domain-containing protein [Thermoplasmatales archaeon]
MNKYHLLSVVFFIIGIVFFSLGVMFGEVETGFFLVFPFLVGSGIYAFLGFILVFVAMLLFMFGFVEIATVEPIDFHSETEEERYPPMKTSVKGGGVILIGPIPIVFSSNWKIAVVLMIVAMLLIITVLFAMSFL